MAQPDDFQRDDALETLLPGSKYHALPAATDLLEQFVIAEVYQRRNRTAGVIDPGYSFVRAETCLQQTGATRVLRGIRWNGCSAFATEFHRCDSHRARIPFFQILHGNSQKVTNAMRRSGGAARLQSRLALPLCARPPHATVVGNAVAADGRLV